MPGSTTSSTPSQSGQPLNATHTDQHSSQNDTLAELRATVDEMKPIIERRLTRASARAQDAMRSYPFATVAAAGVAGALIAVAVTSQRNRRDTDRFSLRRYENMMPAIPVASSILPAQMPSMSSVGNYFERAIDTLSRVDPKALASETVADASKNVQSAWKGLSSMINRS